MFKVWMRYGVSMMTFGLVFGASWCDAADHTKDSLDTVKQNLKEGKAVLVDVRENKEWQMGHIAGATFLPLSELKNGIAAEQLKQRLPEDKIVYTYCFSGNRSRSAADVLNKHGFSIRPLKPGFDALVEAGFEADY